MVSFVFYDLIFLVVFTLIVILFLYIRRDNLKRQGVLYLYRTKIGIKIMDWTVKRFGKILRPLEYVVIASGYILMAGVIWLLGRIVWIYTKPEIIRAIKIPPVLPLFPYATDLFKVDFLPPFYFTYWIIIIAIIAISHEFAHGIFARLNNIKVQSTGFGFLGPFLAAFVEPDEKQMQKAKKFTQLSILGAGTFANVIMGILFTVIMGAFFVASFSPAGIIFNAYPQTVVNTSMIKMIGDNNINSVNQIPEFIEEGLNRIKVEEKTYLIPKENLERVLEKNIERVSAFDDAPAINSDLKGPILSIDGTPITSQPALSTKLAEYSPGEVIRLETLDENEKIIFKDIELGERDGKAYLGLGFISASKKGISGIIYSSIASVKDPSIYYRPKWNGNLAWFIYNLLWWVVLINLSVALVNMLPVGIFDGGRFFYLTIWGITGSEKIGRKAFAFATWLIIAVLIWLMIAWAWAFI